MPHGSSRHAVFDRTYDVRCSVARGMISLRTVKNSLFAPGGPKCSGRPMPLTRRRAGMDPVPIRQAIDWLSDADRSKLTEGNARQVSSRMKVGASGEGT